MEDAKHKTKGEDVCPSKKLERATVEAQLAQTKGPEYWRSLEELAGTPEFQEMLHREFPKGASEWVDSFSRRGFLQLMGASLAMAGMTGCTKLPLEPIVPYVKQPERSCPPSHVLIRDGHDTERICEPGAGGEPSRTSHQD
jgi:molybdopterin-containing oxidoreductase family iron-sulfur binding subunit